MNIAIVGNSHLGALKRAHKSNPEALGVKTDVVFFGAAGRQFAEFAIRDGAFIPTTEAAKAFAERAGGMTQLRLADYDAIILHGISMAEWKGVEDLFAAFHTAPEEAGADPRRFLSSGALTWCLRDVVAANHFIRYGRDMAADGYMGRLIISAAPQFNELLENDPNQGVAARCTELELMEVAVADAAADFNGRFLAQPRDTLNDQARTLARYVKSAGVNEDGEAFGIRQYGHANEDYGTAVLAGLKALLA